MMIDERILDKGGTIQAAAPQADSADPRLAAQRKSDQRRRAKRIMIIVTLVCVAIGLGPTAEQLVRHGWHAFVDRAPGVGGTTSLPEKTPASAGETPKTRAPRPKARTADKASSRHRTHPRASGFRQSYTRTYLM